MKNSLKLSICTLLFACSVSCAYADGMVFEPVEMPSVNAAQLPAASVHSSNVPTATAPVAATSVANQEAAQIEPTAKKSFFEQLKINNQPKVADMSLKENQDMQNALVNLDTSQVELRQNLQTLESKYYDVDSNYQKYKAERSALHKQIRTVNRKLKNIESVKNKIRKNML